MSTTLASKRSCQLGHEPRIGVSHHIDPAQDPCSIARQLLEVALALLAADESAHDACFVAHVLGITTGNEAGRRRASNPLPEGLSYHAPRRGDPSGPGRNPTLSRLPRRGRNLF